MVLLGEWIRLVTQREIKQSAYTKRYILICGQRRGQEIKLGSVGKDHCVSPLEKYWLSLYFFPSIFSSLSYLLMWFTEQLFIHGYP
jgi:hypothetical protein